MYNIVITHSNPDFDAIASAYAALLLHNCDHIALITNSEPNVHEFLKVSGADIKIKRYSEADIANVTHIDNLIITDCKQVKRIGKFSAFLNVAKNVIVYDHHVNYTQDINSTSGIVKPIGSTTTILVNILKEQNYELTKFEATLFALGIYEDTGLLTFSSTTPADALAVSFLLENKADTTCVADFIKRDLNRVQVFILNELLMNLTVVTVAGQDVAISYASIDDYIDEVAYITQRLMLMEGLEALFILLSTGGRVVLVGRSKTSKVDVSLVVAAFGGGGHATAASAIIKDLMLPEALEKLKFVIRDNIKPIKAVSDIMTTPAKFVTSHTTFNEAFELTMKYNLNNMPVVKGNKTVGIITRKDIMQGVKHGLQAEAISDIMQTEFDKVKPDTPFYFAEEIMVYKGQKLIPVEDDKGIIGVVTRTDLLRLMHEEITLRSSSIDKLRLDSGLSRKRNLKQQINDIMAKEVIEVLEDIGKFAENEDVRCYVVGGFVRDIIMKRQNFDIDIVVESDAVQFAINFSNHCKGKIAIFNKYKTAMVTLPNGLKVDFATARTEYYMTPAASPEVEEASIRNDLYRRDFTINAMALRLDGKQYGQLLDFFAGQKDIHDKKIRILHSLSFVDDPSRVFRAIRFAVRFDFEIGSHTERLLKHAESLNLFDKIMGSRLFSELKYILCEDNFLDAIQMIKKYNLLRFFHTNLFIDNSRIERFNRLQLMLNWYKIQFKHDIHLWQARFGVLFSDQTSQEYNETLQRFELAPKFYDELSNDFKLIRYSIATIRRNKKITNSNIVKLFQDISTEGLLQIAAVLGEDKSLVVENYLITLRYMKPFCNGDDLSDIGIAKGEIYKTILEDIHIARLDGIINSKEEEIAYIKERYIK